MTWKLILRAPYNLSYFGETFYKCGWKVLLKWLYLLFSLINFISFQEFVQRIKLKKNQRKINEFEVIAIGLHMPHVPTKQLFQICFLLYSESDPNTDFSICFFCHKGEFAPGSLPKPSHSKPVGAVWLLHPAGCWALEHSAGCSHGSWIPSSEQNIRHWSAVGCGFLQGLLRNSLRKASLLQAVLKYYSPKAVLSLVPLGPSNWYSAVPHLSTSLSALFLWPQCTQHSVPLPYRSRREFGCFQVKSAKKKKKKSQQASSFFFIFFLSLGFSINSWTFFSERIQLMFCGGEWALLCSGMCSWIS